jgi:hypothetical protein
MSNYREEDGQEDYDSSSDYVPSEKDADEESDYDCVCVDDEDSDSDEDEDDEKNHTYWNLPSMYVPFDIMPKDENHELPFEKRCFCLHLTRMLKEMLCIHDTTDRVELIHKAYLFIIYVFEWFLDNFKMDNPKDARLIRLIWRKCDSVSTEILEKISTPGEEPLTSFPQTMDYTYKYPEFYKLWRVLVTVRQSLEAHYTNLEEL